MFEAGGHIYDPGMRWEKLDVDDILAFHETSVLFLRRADEMKLFPE